MGGSIPYFGSQTNGAGPAVGTVRQGSFQKNVPAEAPALAKISSGEKRRRRCTFMDREIARFINNTVTLCKFQLVSFFEIVPTLTMKENVPTTSAAEAIQSVGIGG
ncbi:hypothetical protein [Halpernia sp. GG3]